MVSHIAVDHIIKQVEHKSVLNPVDKNRSTTGGQSGPCLLGNSNFGCVDNNLALVLVVTGRTLPTVAERALVF